MYTPKKGHNELNRHSHVNLSSFALELKVDSPVRQLVTGHHDRCRAVQMGGQIDIARAIAPLGGCYEAGTRGEGHWRAAVLFLCDLVERGYRNGVAVAWQVLTDRSNAHRIEIPVIVGRRRRMVNASGFAKAIEEAIACLGARSAKSEQIA